jgi:hypothetical protein
MTTATLSRWSDRLAWPTVALAAVASGAGLLVEDLYRDNDVGASAPVARQAAPLGAADDLK